MDIDKKTLRIIKKECREMAHEMTRSNISSMTTYWIRGYESHMNCVLMVMILYVISIC